MGQTGIGHQNMGQIFFGAKSARAKYEFGQICLGPTNYLRNWRWPIFLDQLLLGPNADNQLDSPFPFSNLTTVGTVEGAMELFQ